MIATPVNDFMHFRGAASCCEIIYPLAPGWEWVRVRGCAFSLVTPECFYQGSKAN